MAAQKYGRCEDCPPCGQCDIFETGFDEETEDDLVEGCTQVDGAAHQSGGRVVITASDTRYDVDTEHPDAIPSHYVQWTVGHVCADDDGYKVFVGDHHVILTIGTVNGCLALYETAGDVLLTKMRVAAPANTPGTLRVWYGQALGADAQLAAQWEDGDTIGYKVTPNGNAVGFGSATIAGDIEADDFIYQKHWTEDDTSCPRATVDLCPIMVDTFVRPDDTNVGCSYFDVTANFEINTNRAQTASNNAKFLIEKVHPEGKSTGSLRVAVMGFTNDILRVFAADDYYAQLTLGPSKTLKLFDNAAVELASQSISTGNTTITVCLSQDLLSAQVGSTHISAPVTAPAGPTKFGFGTGTIGSTVFFTQVEWGEWGCYECYTDCASECCATQLAEYIADYGAGGLTDDECDGCAAVAGDYTLRRFSSFCEWRYVDDEICELEVDCLGTPGVSPVRLTHLLEIINPCQWRLTATLLPRGDDTCTLPAPATAVYLGPVGLTDCSALPVTLTLQAGSSTGTFCGGAWPATIELQHPNAA